MGASVRQPPVVDRTAGLASEREGCEGRRTVSQPLSPSPLTDDADAPSFAARLARWRANASRRAIGIGLALLAELLLVLVLLTLAPDTPGSKGERSTVFRMDVAPERESEDEKQEDEAAKPKEARADPETPVPPQVPAPVAPPVPPPLPLPVIPMTAEQMAMADITPRTPTPPAPRRAVAGPPDTGGGGSGAFADTPRVEGSGPNGEPLYAAAWYREPYPEELRGYLSTARGPGWALIACRTVREWRVDGCIKLDESPEGSNIARAVLAAAWQFKVRPPRLGGELRYGEWVRIRIDYDLR